MSALIAAVDTASSSGEGFLLCLVYGVVVGAILAVLIYGAARVAAEAGEPAAWGRFAVPAGIVVGALVALFCVL